MKINILSVFPEMFTPITEYSLLGKACKNGILDINIVNIRDFSEDKRLKTDDSPFGGGPGMVMTPQPVFSALRSLGLGASSEKNRIIYMSPRGRMLDRKMIEELSSCESLTVLCGHYEGVDQRIISCWRMEEVSIGDYILTGGELPAMVLVDSVSRFIPRVLGNEASAEDESIYSGLLEADIYTRPADFEGFSVPEVLTGGNHKEIKLWQLMRAIELTYERRRELLVKWWRSGPKMDFLSKKERKKVEEFVEKLLLK